MQTFNEITQYLRKFAKDRDWEQFHSPKNLTMALSIEVSELMEHFQWLSEDQSSALDSATLSQVQDEIADVQLYLLRLADRLGINISEAIAIKTKKNELKYPVAKVKGSAKKYTAYQDKPEEK